MVPSAKRSSCTLGGSCQQLSGKENRSPLQADGLEPARDEPQKSATLRPRRASSRSRTPSAASWIHRSHCVSVIVSFLRERIVSWHKFHRKDAALKIPAKNFDQTRVPAKLAVYLALDCDLSAAVLFQLTRPWRFYHVAVGQSLQIPDGPLSRSRPFA